MRNIFYILSIFFFTNLYSQQKIVSISPLINQNDNFNKSIIITLEEFLEEMSPQFWLKSDFEKYTSPYSEIFDIEAGKLGEDFYKPSLMEITPTHSSDKKIVKIAFIGYNPEDKSNIIKAIYNVVANRIEDKIYFSKYLDFVTNNWKIIQADNIKYFISPSKYYNETEIKKQKNDIAKISKFFDIKPFPINYYSTISPKETFELKGFDYHPMMYIDKSGGFAEGKNIVISGNNSEYYTHEIVHLYTTKLFPNINSFLDEGIATYFGGSGRFDYQWQKEKLKKFLKQNPSFKIAEHLDVYERIYFEQETPVPYIIAGLICERTIKKYGKKRLFEIFESKKDILEILREIGLNKENMDKELRNELGL